MGLEVVVNIADFVTTNPTGSDPKSAGDDHLRYIKTALKNDFAGFTGAVLVTGVDGGAADAYTLTPAHAVVAYTAKMLILFAPTATNLTTTPTLNISGLGAKTIKSVAGGALLAGDLVSGKYYLGGYDGTNINLLAVTKQYIDQLVIAGIIPAQALGFYVSDGAVSAFAQTHTGYAQKEVKGADIVCSATINLTTATGNLVHVTGSTGPVTAFTIPSGAEYTVVWDSTPTITHHATTLILPGATNITVAVGDVWKIRGDGAGNARVVGISSLATSTQLKAGTDASRPATAAALLAAQGFTAYVQTAEQTITSAGALTIAHGLGRAPTLLLGFLKCTTTEAGYAVGDVVAIQLGAEYFTVASDYGVSVIPDATNLNVRYSSSASSCFFVNGKSTGTINVLTNTNWKLILRAWA